MLNEVMHYLKPSGICVDATFGRGGYARAMLAKGATVYGIDRDPTAIAEGKKLASENKQFHMLTGTFGLLDKLLNAAGIKGVEGIAFDLGVSSPQLDVAERGFSFRLDGPLDMRMNPLTGESAADLVNSRSENELSNLIFTYGEDRRARSIARAIVTARAESPIVRTLQLAEIIRQVVHPSNDGIDPATRTFQALRIAVNNELGELEDGLRAAEKILAPGGRLVVVSFHSLEDRIVKDFMRDGSGTAPAPSRHAPAMTKHDPRFQLLTRKPIGPTPEEARSNPRARSAHLRAALRMPTIKEVTT
jgi:16S rRNA (cytosine1402-N4)-methyltransferase